MLTLLLIITFSSITLISGVEKNDTAFIDSLPDKQKKEFLQKVEKRIKEEVPEVKTPEANDTNVDLYEKRLEDQGQSIQKILRSEIDNLKSHPRRDSNDSGSNPLSHVDLTLRTRDDESEASRRGSDDKKIPKKGEMFENIPVAVQYDSGKGTPNNKEHKNATADKNESKPDVITWKNHVMKIVDTNNTLEERNKTGRRSNDFDVSLNNSNVTENPSTSSDTGAVDVTTSYSPSDEVKSTGTTKADDNFRTKRNSDTSTSIHDASTATIQELTHQTESEKSRTTQGNKNVAIDAVDGKSQHFLNLTQNNTTISDSTPNIGESTNTDNANVILNDAMSTITPFDKSLQTGEKFEKILHYADNSQKSSTGISATQDNHDNNITEGNTTVDAVTSSTIINKAYTTSYQMNKTLINVKGIANTPNVSAQADDNNNLPDSTKPAKLDASFQNHRIIYPQTDQIGKQSNITKSSGQATTAELVNNNSNLDNGFGKVNQIYDGATTTDTIGAVTNDMTNSTPLGKINDFGTDKFIIVGSNSLDDGDKQKYDSVTVANVNEAANIHKNIKNVGEVDEAIIVTKLGIADPEKSKTATQTYYTATNSPNAGYTNKNSINTRLHSTALPPITPKEDNEKSNNTFKIFVLPTLHGAYKIGPNSPVDVNETQQKFVPVYNYDPKNAYFNPNIERPENSGIPVIKQTERHSKTTSLDFYLNGNKQSLRVKDVKELVTSAAIDKFKHNFDSYEMIPADEVTESPNDDVYEKPLKHSLAKIRKKLFEHELESKAQNSEESMPENDEANEKKKYSTIKNKHDELDNDIRDLFKNFGTLFKKEDRTDDNETHENKQDSNEVNKFDKHAFKDVANSLEKYNKVMKSDDLQQIIEILTKVHNQISEKNTKQKRPKSNTSYQSRFQIKDRERKHKKDDIENKHLHNIVAKETPFMIGDGKLVYGDEEFEKPNKAKIEDDYVELHINILKDLVYTNDPGLEQYDWLGSTVLIQAGLAKLLEVIGRKLNQKRLYPEDEELLEFTMNIHQIAITLLAKEYEASPVKRKRLSFRIPKPKKGTKGFNTLNRMYGEMKKTRAISLIRSNYGVEDFKEFLDCLSSCLNDFHTAIKQVSRVTTYKNQHWFKNIKQLYLQSATEKEYLELLLHITTARLIGLIEERQTKMVENRFVDDSEADRIGVEFVMTIRICSELTRINE